MQVSEAEAATARLVAQMTDPSPDEQNEAVKSLPLQLHKGQAAGVTHTYRADGHYQHQNQHQQQHSSDRENLPQLQHKTGKRSSNAQSDAAHPSDSRTAGAKKPQAKRQKVSNHGETEMAAEQTLPDGTAAGQDRQPSDAQELLGRVVQQQFEEGLFKVQAVQLLLCTLTDPPLTHFAMVWLAAHQKQSELHCDTCHAHVYLLVINAGSASAILLCRVLSKSITRSMGGSWLYMRIVTGEHCHVMTHKILATCCAVFPR